MRHRPELVRQPPDSPKSKYAAKVIYCNKVVIGRLTNGNIKERRSPVFLKLAPLHVGACGSDCCSITPPAVTPLLEPASNRNEEAIRHSLKSRFRVFFRRAAAVYQGRP
jgi:hypothetical protein